MNKIKKLEKLTESQKEKLSAYRSDWFNVGSSCEPADRKRAEKAICEMYKTLGNKTPEFVWFDSPKQVVIALKKRGKENILSKCWWGSNEAYWISFYKFCEEILGIKYAKKDSEKLDLWAKIARSCGWWWPFADVCLVCERPLEIHWETGVNRPRLHSESGPAVKFRDGFSLHMWHGIRVDPEIIEHPETITLKNIDGNDNAEMRRILIEVYGRERYLKDSGAEIVSEDTLGKLWSTKKGEIVQMVEVINRSPERDGTRRVFFIPVPNTIKTAKEAVAWTYEMDEKEYNPEIGT